MSSVPLAPPVSPQHPSFASAVAKGIFSYIQTFTSGTIAPCSPFHLVYCPSSPTWLPSFSYKSLSKCCRVEQTTHCPYSSFASFSKSFLSASPKALAKEFTKAAILLVADRGAGAAEWKATPHGCRVQRNGNSHPRYGMEPRCSRTEAELAEWELNMKRNAR